MYFERSGKAIYKNRKESTLYIKKTKTKVRKNSK